MRFDDVGYVEFVGYDRCVAGHAVVVGDQCGCVLYGWYLVGVGYGGDEYFVFFECRVFFRCQQDVDCIGGMFCGCGEVVDYYCV